VIARHRLAFWLALAAIGALPIINVALARLQ
jgi:hypothetical protein